MHNGPDKENAIITIQLRQHAQGHTIQNCKESGKKNHARNQQKSSYRIKRFNS